MFLVAKSSNQLDTNCVINTLKVLKNQNKEAKGCEEQSDSDLTSYVVTEFNRNIRYTDLCGF